ncbi:MAG TPA: maltose ABC transporter substrate-binding protein [Aggregatilineaceae bacterium]|nr:maltose ABC transporter substrate-binding protein [Aggregatilineaceae bacterium]
MKKYLILVLVVALALGVLPAVTSAQQEKPSLLIWADDTRAPVIQDLGKSFADEYGVTLTVQQLSFGEIRDQLKIAGPAGEGPDVIIGAHDWLGELVTNGLLAEVDLGDAVKDFAPAAIQALTWEGKLYGVPYAIENVGFFYNTDLVPTAPATFDEVVKVSEELMSSGKAKYGFVRQDADPYHFFPIQTAFGGYIFGLTDTGDYTADDVGVDNEGSVAALKWYQDLVKAGSMPTGLDNNAAVALMQSGDAAMYITGPWSIGPLTTANVPFAIAPIPAGPAGPGKPFLGVQAFMVSAFSKNPLVAQAFLTEWVGSEEVQLALYEKGQRTPALLSAQAKVDDPNLVALGKAGEVGQPMPGIPAMSAVWTAWGNAIQLAEDPSQDVTGLAKAAGDAIREAAKPAQ